MDDYLTIQQTAQEVFLGLISPHSVRRWHVKGVGTPPIKLPATRIGRDYFVKREDAERFKAAIADPALYRNRQKSERSEQAKKRLERAGAQKYTNTPSRCQESRAGNRRTKKPRLAAWASGAMICADHRKQR